MKQFYFLAFLFLSLKAMAQQDSISDFLLKNQQEIQSFQESNISFNKDFFGNQVFLFGETHGSALPQQYDLSLFKLLHEKASVNYYVAEVDDTKAWMLNNYLKDGNTHWLDQVFASWVRDTAQWANREYYAKFVALREYYQSLSASTKLAEIGGFQTLKLTDKGSCTTDAFQYILLFRNSPAATPLD